MGDGLFFSSYEYAVATAVTALARGSLVLRFIFYSSLLLALVVVMEDVTRSVDHY